MPGSLRSHGGLLVIWLLAVALTVTGFWVASRFVKPAPPDRIVLATGGTDGAYHAWGKRLAPLLVDEGIELELRATAGSVENAALLADGAVDLAILQGGTPVAGSVRGLASLFFEPLWLFVRQDAALGPVRDIGATAGLRTSIGPEGSGKRALVLELLALAGVEGASWQALSSADAVTALGSGELDAAFVVASESAASVQALLAANAVRPATIERTEAYHLNRRHLAPLTLPRGAADLARDVPAETIRMPGVAAMLVSHEDLHPALVDLVLMRARMLDRDSLFSAPGAFPSPDHLSVPIDPGAARFHEKGPSFLQRYLPFWAATLIDRTIVLLLPLVALVIPMGKLFPPLYRWRVRSRIYRWYDDLQMLERRVETDDDWAGLRAAADSIEHDVAQVSTPLSHADELYHLKLHIDLVRKRIDAREAGTAP